MHLASLTPLDSSKAVPFHLYAAADALSVDMALAHLVYALVNAWAAVGFKGFKCIHYPNASTEEQLQVCRRHADKQGTVHTQELRSRVAHRCALSWALAIQPGVRCCPAHAPQPGISDGASAGGASASASAACPNTHSHPRILQKSIPRLSALNASK